MERRYLPTDDLTKPSSENTLIAILKSHDPSQRANGMLTIAGGIVITFTKEILTLITGG